MDLEDMYNKNLIISLLCNNLHQRYTDSLADILDSDNASGENYL